MSLARPFEECRAWFPALVGSTVTSSAASETWARNKRCWFLVLGCTRERMKSWSSIGSESRAQLFRISPVCQNQFSMLPPETRLGANRSSVYLLVTTKLQRGIVEIQLIREISGICFSLCPFSVLLVLSGCFCF